jgi:hypothetical protein
MWMRQQRCLQPLAHAGSSLADFSAPKMKAICSSETLVHTRSTRRHIPQDGILDNHVVVSHKLCGFQGRVGGHVVMKEQCGTCSNLLLDLLANSITDPSGVCELMDCSATVFVDDFWSNWWNEKKSSNMSATSFA